MTTERLTTVTNYHCALYFLKDLCPLLFTATVMVDFETSEHTAIRQLQVFTDSQMHWSEAAFSTSSRILKDTSLMKFLAMPLGHRCWWSFVPNHGNWFSGN